jgi:hypothetical protein
LLAERIDDITESLLKENLFQNRFQYWQLKLK